MQTNKAVREGLQKIELKAGEGPTFPNVLTPVAGIINYYKSVGLDFVLAEPKPHAFEGLGLLHPYTVDGNESNLQYPLNKIWLFHDSKNIFQLVNSYVEEVSRRVVCQPGVLEAIEWCLNEIMENVLLHSGAVRGFVLGQHHITTGRVAFCIFDTGQGIYNSFHGSAHSPRTPLDAITKALEEGVTRNKEVGRGNGLWGLHELVSINRGILQVTSDTAAYKLDQGKPWTFESIPVIDTDHRCTTVDFQIDASKAISFSEAMKGYRPVNLRIENLEDENDRIVIRIKDEAEGTGTRESGIRFRNKTLNVFQEANAPIELNFSEVSVVSSSFADEVIGELLSEFGFVEFNRVFRLTGMNETVSAIVHRVVAKRMAATLQE